MLVNKDLARAAEVRLDLGPKAKPGAATLFRLPNPPGPITKELLKAGIPGITVMVPPLSAAMLVRP